MSSNLTPYATLNSSPSPPQKLGNLEPFITVEVENKQGKTSIAVSEKPLSLMSSNNFSENIPHWLKDKNTCNIDY